MFKDPEVSGGKPYVGRLAPAPTGALHVGNDTIQRAVASGALRGVLLPGKKVRFTKEAVRAWLGSCETAPTDWRVK